MSYHDKKEELKKKKEFFQNLAISGFWVQLVLGISLSIIWGVLLGKKTGIWSSFQIIAREKILLVGLSVAPLLIMLSSSLWLLLLIPSNRANKQIKQMENEEVKHSTLIKEENENYFDNKSPESSFDAPYETKLDSKTMEENGK